MAGLLLQYIDGGNDEKILFTSLLYLFSVPLCHFPASMSLMIFFLFSALWWPAAGSEHICLMCLLVTLYPCVHR